MFNLSLTTPTVFEWKAAGIAITLVPLSTSKKEEFVKQTISQKEEDGKIISERNNREFARLVGQHCIKDWSGMCDDKGNEVACNPESIEIAMQIEPFEEFVFQKIHSLEMFVKKEVAEAKKD